MQAGLIDDGGKWWDADSWQLRKSLYLADVEGDIAPVVIDKLGFIRVSHHHARAIIRFNPATLSTAAFVGLYYWFSTHFCRRICLSFALDGHDQRREIHGSARATLLRMESLSDLRRQRSWKPLFAARDGKPGELPQGSASSVLFDHWRSTGGIFAESDYLPLLNRFAGNRYVIFAPGSCSGHFTVAQAGDGLLIPDKHAHEALAGSRLESLADQEYAEWVSCFYSAALDSQQPRYDHIRAYICWPRAGRTERRYSRLILPCRTSGGRQVLLGVSGPLAVPQLDFEAA
jgi:cell wall assembly regulator SMI1